MMSETSVVPGLYLGGLRNDLDPDTLAGRICGLLWKCQVHVPMENIHISKNRKRKAFALVDLPDEGTSQFLLLKLSSLGNKKKFFDLRTITFDPSDWRVGPRYANSATGGGPKVQFQKQTKEEAAARATRALDRVYRLGEVVGRETRHSEFKQGGMAHKDRSWLQETVGKYICGFLNSGEGGTLYFGVNDDGKVSGFSCPHSKEDNFRLLIDETLKSIQPPVFTDSYEVRFVPVVENDGRLSESLRVLEIEVWEGKRLKQLYFYGDNAFLRRDGSSPYLSAPEVQEWTRKQVEREVAGTLLKSQLREMATQLKIEREKNADMEQQLTQLEIKKKKKHSKSCLIM